MENGSPLMQDVRDGLPEQGSRPNDGASVNDEYDNSGTGIVASEIPIAASSEISEHEELPSGADKKRSTASLRKTQNRKTDLKELPVSSKKKPDRSTNAAVVSSPRALEAASGIPRAGIPHVNVRAPASLNTSIQKEKGLEISLGSKAMSNSPSSRHPHIAARSPHSNFTVPRPFNLATDRRASLGGHSSAVHPFGKSRSFQASRKDGNIHSNDGVNSPRLVDSPNFEKDQGTVQMRASANSFSFNSDVRAERRKEFNSKLEERLTAKEVASKQAQAKTKDKINAEIKEFRKSLSFKATPMPTFYHDPTPPKPEIKKIPPTRPKSPKLGRKSNSTDPASDAKSESLGCALDGEQILPDTDYSPSEMKVRKAHVSVPVSKTPNSKGITAKGAMPNGRKSLEMPEDEGFLQTQEQSTRSEQVSDGKVCDDSSTANVDVITPGVLNEYSQAVVKLDGENVDPLPTATAPKELHRKKNDVNPKLKSAGKANLNNSFGKVVAHHGAVDQRASTAKKEEDSSTSNGGSSKNVQTGKAAIKYVSRGGQELSPVSSIVADMAVAS